MVRILPANTFELLFTSRTEEHIVDLDEDIDECLFEILLLELSVALQLLDKVVSAVFGDLSSSVAIKDGEKGEARDEIGSRDVRVFIRLAPALHARSAILEL